MSKRNKTETKKLGNVSLSAYDTSQTADVNLAGYSTLCMANACECLWPNLLHAHERPAGHAIHAIPAPCHPVHPCLQKPETFRLACQSNVGDGSNSGSMKVRVKP